jgi:hypothetical protein
MRPAARLHPNIAAVALSNKNARPPGRRWRISETIEPAMRPLRSRRRPNASPQAADERDRVINWHIPQIAQVFFK